MGSARKNPKSQRRGLRSGSTRQARLRPKSLRAVSQKADSEARAKILSASYANSDKKNRSPLRNSSQYYARILFKSRAALGALAGKRAKQALFRERHIDSQPTQSEQASAQQAIQTKQPGPVFLIPFAFPSCVEHLTCPLFFSSFLLAALIIAELFAEQ